MTETTYTLRDLSAKDIFPMSKIISKIGIAKFTDAFQSEDVKAAITALTDTSGKANTGAASVVGISVALNIANVVFENLSSAEQDIYRFLSGLCGIPAKQIGELPMNTFVEMIVDVIQKPEFKGFIKVVSKLFKSEN